MNLYEFYPLTWYHNNRLEELYCKGLTENERQILLKISLGSTKILTSVDEINSNELEELKDNYNASEVLLSRVNRNVLVLRNPIITSNDNWVSIDSDPVGKVTSFFQIKGLNLYESFLLQFPEKINLTNYELEVHEKYIIKSNKKVLHAFPGKHEGQNRSLLKRIYWDIEVVTPRKEFVYAKYIDNHVISISLITESTSSLFSARENKEQKVRKSYFLYWGSYDIENKNFEAIRFSRESDMLIHFFDMIEKFNPDRMYSYNGDSFDIPYLVERCTLHGIVPSGSIKFINKRIKVRFQWETVKAFDSLEIEHFDILRIMLRFYPGLPNYKLETIGKLFLGEGKTGLDIEEMFTSFYAQRSEGMEDLARYSIQDSLLLANLNEKLGFDELLENVANSCGILCDQILDIPDEVLVDKCAFMVDPGSYNLAGKIVKSNFLSNIKQNYLYKDIYIYDYTIYYSIEMQQSKDQFNYDLSLRSLELPGKIKSELYWSRYLIRENEENLISQLIELNKERIIEVTDTTIKSVGPMEDLIQNSLILVNRYSYYLQLGKLSYVAKDIDGTLIKVGNMKVLKPTFKISKDYLNNVLNYIFTEGQIGIPPDYDVEDGIYEDYEIETKLKDIAEYKEGTDKFILAKQFNERIKTWTRVKYYQTIQGPILKALYKDEVLDTDFYEKELKEIKKLLKYKNQ